MIVTSINMHKNTLNRITLAAEILGRSRRAVILHLMMRMMRDVEKYHRRFSTVAYQPADPEGSWYCFPIKLNDDENEYFSDLRKFCKCSVSLLLAIAVRIYLQDMILDNRSVNKNFLFKGYSLERVVIKNIQCWRIYWGEKEKGQTGKRK